MELTYDLRYNIAYLHFREKRGLVDSIRLGDELAVDLGPDRTVYGIELLNANEQLRREDAGQLLILNEATGLRVEVSLALMKDAA